MLLDDDDDEAVDPSVTDLIIAVSDLDEDCAMIDNG